MSAWQIALAAWAGSSPVTGLIIARFLRARPPVPRERP